MTRTKTPQCPHGYRYGIDTDDFEIVDICDTCEVWDNCKDAFETNGGAEKRRNSPQQGPPKKDYAALLQHPKWQRKRLEIFQRDNFTCLLCNDTETTLHCHHKKYEYGKNPWEYENDVFMTLCKNCHECIERLKKAKDEFDESTLKMYHGEEGYSLFMDKSPKVWLRITDKILFTIEGKKPIQGWIDFFSNSINNG